MPDFDPHDPRVRAAARKLAVREFWRRGDLFYLLHATQRKIKARIEASSSRRHFLCCSRRLGKSFMLVCLAFEVALKKPNARILYLAPFGHDAQKIVQDTADHILPDCPEEFRPAFRTGDREFVFKNGSTIRFKGTNGERAQYLRGGAADLVVLDECGIMDSLDEVVNQVVEPMTLTTNGLVIMATTPSSTPAHESKRLCDEAFRDGCGYEFTLLDAPHLNAEAKTRALKSAGENEADIPAMLEGKKEPQGTTALREYWCRWLTDAGSAVIPEFNATCKAEIVQERPRPPYFDCYTAMDPGYVDNTGVLFGYWDVRAGKLVIEDEWLARHAGTVEIAEAIKAKELALWDGKQPYMRVSDIEKRLISDLVTDHHLPFTPALKHDAHGAIWNMRQMFKNRSLVIHPRCVHLLRQVETATWNKKGTDFADEYMPEDEQRIAAHFDLVSALRYLCRMINKNRNPYPSYHFDTPRGIYKSVKGRETRKTIRTDTPLSRKLDKAGK